MYKYTIYIILFMLHLTVHWCYGQEASGIQVSGRMESRARRYPVGKVVQITSGGLQASTQSFFELFRSER
jgi:hypothetical protein